MDPLAVALAIEGHGRLAPILDAVRAFSTPLGYDRFVLYSASASHEALIDRMYWVEGSWFDASEPVDAAAYIRHCPVTRHVLDVAEPFFWTKEPHRQGERYRVVPRPRGAGVHGIQVPMFGPRGLEGAMSAGGLRIDASAEARLGMSVVGTAAFHAARRLLEPVEATTQTTLSKRELEVLAWIAAGRRHADVAANLGLSERTVENHLRRIRTRLGVATTAHAVTVAIRKGLIDA